MVYRYMGGAVVMLHSFLILTLNGVSGQLHVLADLPQGKKPTVPITQEGRWAVEQVWTFQRQVKSLATA